MSSRPNTRTEMRKKGYKTGLDAEEARRRRQDNLADIRKNKRMDNLLKKRMEGFPLQSQSLDVTTDTQNPAVLQKLLEATPVSGDTSEQPEATTQFRKMLTAGPSSPVNEVIKAGLVPLFVQFLVRHDLPQLQFNAACALTIIASKNTRAVIEHDAVPMFVQLLSSTSDDVREQAVWALGNVAGDSPSSRDLVLSNGALMPLLDQLNMHSKLSMLRIATWALSNLCGGEPPTPIDRVKPALPILKQLLIQSNDDEVLTDACRALYFLSDGPDRIQAVIEAGVCQRLVDLLLSKSPKILIPALQTMGNLTTGNNSQIQLLIDNNVLPCLFQLLLFSQNNHVLRSACSTIIHITAGNTAHIQAVINANIIIPLVYLSQHAEFDIKKKAVLGICNALAGGSRKQIQRYMASPCCIPLCDLLTSPDPSIVTLSLLGLENILEVAEADDDGVNGYARMIYNYQGTDEIRKLLKHQDDRIFVMASRIFCKYFWAFAKEDEEEVWGRCSAGMAIDNCPGEDEVTSQMRPLGVQPGSMWVGMMIGETYLQLFVGPFC